MADLAKIRSEFYCVERVLSYIHKSLILMLHNLMKECHARTVDFRVLGKGWSSFCVDGKIHVDVNVEGPSRIKTV